MSSNLVKRGFLSLLGTQFLGAANDNILKQLLIFMVIDGAWSGRLGAGGQGIVGLCFTLPFILLSGYAGQFADRNSKRSVSVLVKVIEIPIAIIALVGFWTGHLWVVLGALVALSCQSAFFGPAKYGMIPELVEPGDLSRANGTINMMTNIAVIAGTVAGGIIADVYYGQPDSTVGGANGVLWLPGAVMVAVAVAGLGAVLFLVKLEAGDRDLKYDWNPFATYVASIRQMSRSPLLMVALAWGYFYLLAGLALLIIPEYKDVLAISYSRTGLLLGIMGVAIGAGSVTAGLVSGHRIEPRLVPVGAVGLSVFFVLLGVVPPTFWNVAGFIFGAGFFAGFYIIPLQALLQQLSPDDERGRFLGTANGISFAFLATGFGLFAIIKPRFGFDSAPQRIFLISAALMIAGMAYFILRLRRSVFGGRPILRP